MKIETILRILRNNPDGINGCGNALFRTFAPSERYAIDFAPDFRPNWEQYDTDQDAEYFGVWVNRPERLILTYCEGDWTLVECPDDAHWCAEVEHMNTVYGVGQIATCIGNDGSAVVYSQDRTAFTAVPPRKVNDIGDVLRALEGGAA